MNTYNNGARIEKTGKEPQGRNSPYILVKTSNGTIRRPNPAYVPPTKKGILAKLFS